MEPAAYAGNMGTGLIDAYKLLKAVEGGGVEMTVPNMYVAVEATSKINYSRYFKNGENMTLPVQLMITQLLPSRQRTTLLSL